MRTRPSVGFIPDGGRRWAVREKVPLEHSYKRSFLGLAALITNCDLGDSSIYCLSAANLKRTSAELAAVYAAIEAVVYDLESKNLRPIVWGDISALPREFRIWCRAVNMRSCRKADRNISSQQPMTPPLGKPNSFHEEELHGIMDIA